MELGLIVIFALRLLVPLLIFRRSLLGGFAALVVDALDTNIVKLFGVEIPNYVQTDKLLDMYYLSIELIVSRHWANVLARRTSLFLYVWRLVGVVVFELVPAYRVVLFIAPNIFEHFFLLYAFMRTRSTERTAPFWLNSYQRVVMVVGILWLTKIPQELVLHVYQVGSPVEAFVGWMARWWH
jgi:hypothetical protein